MTQPLPLKILKRRGTVTHTHLVRMHLHYSSSPSLLDPSTNQRRFLVEHYKSINPMVILTQALGHPRRKGLVKIQRTPLSDPRSTRERETAHLDPLACRYLEEKGVWNVPSSEIW